MQGNIAIFWPMIVQAFLTLAVYVVMFLRRQAAVRAGEARARDFRLPGSEPERSATAVRNLANQYELPVLFFVVCLSLYVTNGAHWLAVILAWVFVVTRILHAAVHLGSNDLRLRAPAFAAGLLAVALLWLILAFHVFNVAGVLEAAGTA
jgi:hypothetical protein